MKVIHRADDRGWGDHGWLSTRYSFSFADWYNPERMGFGVLRVINDDTIVPGAGFPPHSHRDMEIITIVTSGTLAHEDSMGNKGLIHAGDVQTMSAGTGVTHSEFNASQTEPLSLFQIWIETGKRGIVPQYSQKSFGDNTKMLTTLVGPDESEGAVPIAQDAKISSAHVTSELTYAPSKEHGVYIFVIEGEIEIEGEKLGARDAIGITEVKEITLSGQGEVLIIEVPMH